MGVKNLWDILESCKKTLPLHYLQNKRVCVDLSCWMVQLQNVNKSHCPMNDKLYLKGLFHRLRALIALNCSLIFVTDGAIPAIKLSTYRRRLNAGNEAIQDAGNSRTVSVKRNKGSEFSCMIKEAKFLGVALGIPCLDGIEEAEAQCALLNSESLCDGCFTSDSDAFLFGARTVYRDICLGDGGYVVCYEMDDIERQLGLEGIPWASINMLCAFGIYGLQITLAILLGSDYTQGVRGFGPESACQIVKSIGDSAVLQRFASEGLSIAKKQKGSKKKGQTYKDMKNNADSERDFNGSECDLPIDNKFLQVINAYLMPKCHSADSGAVHRVLALYPFNRSQLHQICAQFFDWPPEKTDAYILPKIAERNLRRFANLRSTSLELGLHLPINEIPVKCPISSIIKQRKFQGKYYFEVSWEDMDGLKASAVPADLVERVFSSKSCCKHVNSVIAGISHDLVSFSFSVSACPEKIVEFHERKAEKQKAARRSRPMKADKRAAEMKEIEEKLQKLLLEIEQESITASNAVSLGALMPQKIPTNVHVDLDDRRLCLNAEVVPMSREGNDSSNRGSSGSGFYSTASASLETEIIDLVSPPPRVHTHEVLKCQEVRNIDVIELSDTDDASPEHARKARELRLFMASIRDENL
ncbi:UNVERIFIED_CONTAM: Flap endonuclease GEN-like 2 [Sesamum radiatum]|uniref:Single-strand DNA endonuclease 1 n=1 Tax=Sesamum radiatum TaxID=300843 RepID=A0AAW2JYL4_SESRA